MKNRAPDAGARGEAPGPAAGPAGRVAPEPADTGREAEDVGGVIPEHLGGVIPSTVNVAVIGRPNVGKSSLVNAFLGRERVIVSEVAGTTRDAIDTELEVDTRPASSPGTGTRRIRLVDTAGIRRQAKVQESVEYYTVLRSQRAAERADVALVVCDAPTWRIGMLTPA